MLDRNEAAAKAVAKKLGGIGLGCDVTDRASVDSAFDAIVKRFGGLDVLVSNAGAAWQERIGKVDPKAFNAALRDTPLYVKDHPGILMDVKFDKNGDPDRVSYIVEIRDGKQVVLQTLPPNNPF